MRLVVTVEYRFPKTPTGQYLAVPSFGPRFWQRYLTVFDGVLVIGRTEPLDAAGQTEHLVPLDHPRVELLPLSAFRGVRGFASQAHRTAGTSIRALQSQDAILMRVPSPISLPLTLAAWSQRRPYGLEVLGDPHGVMARGAHAHPLRPILRLGLTRQLVAQAKHAAVVSYVSRLGLRDRYPAGEPCREYFAADAPSFEYDLPGGASRGLRVEARPQRRCIQRIVTVASLEQPYKGIDTLLRALADAAGRGVGTCLEVLGDGRHRWEYENQATALGISDRVIFRGTVSAENVLEALDRSDLFVLASRTEGLPRAMVEAMGRGLPCLGTPVGGIPELLSAQCLFPVDDHQRLADLIVTLDGDLLTRQAMADMNVERAGDFQGSRLQEEREKAYRALKAATEAWINRKGA